MEFLCKTVAVARSYSRAGIRYDMHSRFLSVTSRFPASQVIVAGCKLEMTDRGAAPGTLGRRSLMSTIALFRKYETFTQTERAGAVFNEKITLLHDDERDAR